MLQVAQGQCGMCTHFGEVHPNDQRLMQIRTTHKAPENFVDECDHPKHAALHLMVTPISRCDGFEPAKGN